jgi:hypothetical protein
MILLVFLTAANNHYSVVLFAGNPVPVNYGTLNYYIFPNKKCQQLWAEFTLQHSRKNVTLW